MTPSSFFLDLTLAARRLGYPLDCDAERLLVSTLTLPAEEWKDSPYKRSHTMTRGRRMLMRAVQLALSSGLSFVDGTTMAVAIADDELPQALAAPHHSRWDSPDDIGRAARDASTPRTHPTREHDDVQRLPEVDGAHAR